jgi:hypothetical protein
MFNEFKIIYGVVWLFFLTTKCEWIKNGRNIVIHQQASTMFDVECVFFYS